MDLSVAIFFIVFGLLIGSFLNVVILRLPLNKDLVYQRSVCPKCGFQLRWYHNIPVFSFLVLRGRCASCASPISWRYPLIEIFTGLVSFWLMPEDLGADGLGQFAFYFAIACIFICHLFIDLDHHLLLDTLNLYLLLIILPYSVFYFPWSHWLLGGAIGFLGPLSVTWIFYKLRGQVGLGGGDIKLFGILGLMLGPMGIVSNIFLSCLLGSILGIGLILAKRLTKEKPMAFGPAILLVGVVQIYFPEHFHRIQSYFI